MLTSAELCKRLRGYGLSLCDDAADHINTLRNEIYRLEQREATLRAQLADALTPTWPTSDDKQ